MGVYVSTGNRRRLIKDLQAVWAKGLLLIFLLTLMDAAFAQQASVTGRIVNAQDSTAVPYASVFLRHIQDSARTYGTITSADGRFKIEEVKYGRYVVRVSSVGYAALTDTVRINKSEFSTGIYRLETLITQLNTVKVETQMIRVVQKEDTTEFQAGSYQTHPDATAEDLVKKMPGFTTDGTTLKIHGEEVKKVLVDGKQFFGDDPNATLKNLPAEVVEKIQVFDKGSDQAQFTGFRDGDEEKALNIITKNGKNAGTFGKVYGGYGSDSRYSAGLVFNQFDEKRRISVLGMTNNINQQNFSISDIMSVMSNSGSRQGDMPGPGSGGPAFFSGQQAGNTHTHALGINYIDEFGKKVTFNGSYFMNISDNTNHSGSTRNYFTEDQLMYTQINDGTTRNLNHRLNARVEYKADSSNTFILSPRITLQQYLSQSDIMSSSAISPEKLFLSSTSSAEEASSIGYNLQNDLQWQHRFQKKGRTLSLNFSTQYNHRDRDGVYESSSLFDDSTSVSVLLHQNNTSFSNALTLGGNITYTEPLGDKVQLLVSYRPTRSVTTSDKSTWNLDQQGEYINLDSTLSNAYQNIYESHQAGTGLRYNSGKLQMNAGLDVQQIYLNGKQSFPGTSELAVPFLKILPNAMMNYKFSKSKNLRISYRTSSRTPGYTQLQEVLDVSNPLLVKSGNMNLEPSYEQNLMMRLGLSDQEKARSFFIFLMANKTDRYISNITRLITQDTLIQGYTLRKGSQLITPVNLDDYYTMRAFSVYSFPLKAIQSNLNLNAGYNYSHTPAILDGNLKYADAHTLQGGIYLSSNISSSFDFTLGYNGSVYRVINNGTSGTNSQYFSHNTSVKLNYLVRDRIVINSDLTQVTYTGLGEEYDRRYYLWNAYIGYKFLKNKSLELKASVYDILKQQQSISRSITESYTEDSETDILQRYLMVSLTYTFKKYKSGTAEEEQKSRMKDMPQPPPGVGPPPGGGPPPERF